MSFVLFVCTQATIRSRTAEVLCLLGGVPARCAGTSPDAFVPLNNALLLGASEVICMERSHAAAVREFAGAEGKDVCSLGIPDDFEPFDPALVDLLVASLCSHSPKVAEAIERGAGVAQVNGFNFRGTSRQLSPLATPFDRAALW